MPVRGVKCRTDLPELRSCLFEVKDTWSCGRSHQACRVVDGVFGARLAVKRQSLVRAARPVLKVKEGFLWV